MKRQGRVRVSEVSGMGDPLFLTPFGCLDLRGELALGAWYFNLSHTHKYTRTFTGTHYFFLLHPEWLLTLSISFPPSWMSLPK